MADAARAARGHEVVCVSHQLPIWTARRAVEGQRLWHDPRHRQCALASVTTFRYTGGHDHQRQLLRAGRLRAAADARCLRPCLIGRQPVISLARAAQAARREPAEAGQAQWGLVLLPVGESRSRVPSHPPDPPPRRGGTRRCGGRPRGRLGAGGGGLHHGQHRREHPGQQRAELRGREPGDHRVQERDGAGGPVGQRPGGRRREARADRLPRSRRGAELLGLLVHAVPRGSPRPVRAGHALQGVRGPVPRHRHPGQPGQRRGLHE